MNLDPLQRRVTDLSVDRLLEAIELIRNNNPTNGSQEISISVLCTLLYVGSRNECHKQALEEDLEMTRASTSRNTDMLSKHHRLLIASGKRKPGLGLIRKEVDSADRRRTVLTLTKK